MVNKVKTTKKSEQDVSVADPNVDISTLDFESPEEYKRLFDLYNIAFVEKTKMMNSFEEERQKIIDVLKALYQNHRSGSGPPPMHRPIWRRSVDCMPAVRMSYILSFSDIQLW